MQRTGEIKVRGDLIEKAIAVLRSAREPLTLDEVVEAVRRQDPTAFRGRSPRNSLYSMIFRRERRRREMGLPPLLDAVHRDRVVRYSVHQELDKKAKR